MKKPKTNMPENVAPSGNSTRKHYDYKPSCQDCKHFDSAGFTTKANALILIDGHRAESSSHSAFALRTAKNPLHASKERSLEAEISGSFRPYCSSCKTYKHSPFTDEASARMNLKAHQDRFPFHICGIEQQM